MQVGTGQNGPKGGQQAIKMCFGTVLDHWEAIGRHLKAKKVNFLNIFVFAAFCRAAVDSAGFPAAYARARTGPTPP